MRILHISDLHLSGEQLAGFRQFYLDALKKDIEFWSGTRKIDLIFLTGDLLDRAGASFKTTDPYCRHG